jgi:uncharacterized protein (DUF433 family)
MARPLGPGITADPDVMQGKPVVAGTRVLVTTILGHLAAGDPIDDVAQDYGVRREDVLSCLAYATTVVAEKVSRSGE